MACVAATAVVTKAVVAIAVVLLPAVCVVAIVPVGNVGVPVNVGLADITTLPLPVIAFETNPLLPSENTGKDAVNVDSIGCALKVATPVTPKVVSKVTASSTFNVPSTVVITPEEATLTTPPPVAKEVAPDESNVLTDVSPITSNVPPTEVLSENVFAPAIVWSFKLEALPVIPVNPEPSPTKEVAVTLPAMLVVPSNKILKASDILEESAPFPITKAVFAVENELHLLQKNHLNYIVQ